ncbi:MAG: toprim domain-containing protein [Magnetococcales bacterium]|nr:toprim domain-containing protein [Magnetococcales bacterium]
MNAAQLTQSIDLHALAQRDLGMRRPGDKGNYCAPWRDDGKPSLSIYSRNGKQGWKDHGTGEGGDAIDLVKKVKGLDTPEAMRFLHQAQGISFDAPARPIAPPAEESQPQRLWRNARSHPDISLAAEYLIQARRLPQDLVTKWQGNAFGFTDWTPKDGDPAGFGPAIVFPVVDQAGTVQAINQRYVADGHQPKMRMIGEAREGMYCPDPATLRQPVIWLVESPIDALTLTAAGCPAVAFLSASQAESFPLAWLNGDRQRMMILADADQAGDKAGSILYHRALSARITAQIVDWSGHKDPNAALQAGIDLKEIKAMAATPRTTPFPAGAPFLPKLEYGRMQGYACGLDTVDAVKSRQEDGEEVWEPVAGFRPYRIDTIKIHDPTTALNHGDGGRPARRLLITYRRPEAPALLQKVVDVEDFGKPAVMQQLGFVHDPRRLAYLLQTLSRDQRQALESVGVVGLVQVGQQVKIIDASNSYLTEEECIYSRLRIPSAAPETARPILESMAGLLKDDLALIWLGWHLGSLMKVFLGFWPHLSVSGHAGSGKTFIAGVIQTLTGCECREPTILQTSFRRMKALANHLYPSIFDEISRASKDDLANFVDLLNTSYRYGLRPHGTKGLFLVAAPVCLVGQDNPVTDPAINSKMIAFELDGMKNESGKFEPDAPFPVREWAQWLVARWDRKKAAQRLKVHKDALAAKLTSRPDDTNISRFVENYAALQFALEELLAFAGYEKAEILNHHVFAVLPDIMNRHLRDSEVMRRESVAILDRLAREIMLTREQDLPPFEVAGNRLFIPSKIILDFLGKRAPGFHSPVVSTQRLHSHLKHDGFLLSQDFQKRIKGQRFNCVVLDLAKMAEAGIDWPRDDPSETER